jgi:hypothetical protein
MPFRDFSNSKMAKLQDIACNVRRLRYYGPYKNMEDTSMSESVEAQLSRLIARVELLEAEREITRTLYRYAHTIDRGDEAGWADCFTAEGRFVVSSPDPTRQPVDVGGAANLLGFAQRHTRPPELYHQHCLIEPIIDVDLAEGRAHCVSYMFTFMRWNGTDPVMRTFGRYIDELSRGADGRWRIVLRHAELDAVKPGLPPIGYGRGLQQGSAQAAS